jgi:hypothetical protein
MPTPSEKCQNDPATDRTPDNVDSQVPGLDWGPKRESVLSGLHSGADNTEDTIVVVRLAGPVVHIDLDDNTTLTFSLTEMRAAIA